MALGKITLLAIVLALVPATIARRRDLRDFATLLPPHKTRQQTRFKSKIVSLLKKPKKVTASSKSTAKCPLSEDLQRPARLKNSNRCPEYASYACCSEREHAKLDQDFLAAYEAIYSECSGCLENMRLLLCQIYCSPRQHQFVEVFNGPSPVLAPTVSKAIKAPNKKTPNVLHKIAFVPLCDEACKRWYQSCSETPAGNLFQDDSASFCLAQMNSARLVFLRIVNQTDPKPHCLNIGGPDVCTVVAGSQWSSTSPWRSHMVVALLWIIAMLVIFAGLLMCCLTLGGVLGAPNAEQLPAEKVFKAETKRNEAADDAEAMWTKVEVMRNKPDTKQEPSGEMETMRDAPGELTDNGEINGKGAASKVETKQDAYEGTDNTDTNGKGAASKVETKQDAYEDTDNAETMRDAPGEQSLIVKKEKTTEEPAKPSANQLDDESAGKKEVAAETEKQEPLPLVPTLPPAVSVVPNLPPTQKESDSDHPETTNLSVPVLPKKGKPPLPKVEIGDKCESLYQGKYYTATVVKVMADGKKAKIKFDKFPTYIPIVAMDVLKFQKVVASAAVAKEDAASLIIKSDSATI